MSERTKIATSAIAIIASAFVAAPGHSQTADDNSARGVEEIVVTAQKRSENLQRVPIAVSAISADTAASLGIQDTTDLQAAIPGLVMHHQGYSMQPVLRGISSQSGSAQEEAPIATYVDGVYLVSPSQGVFALNNIERVEVLKGPQGTLFGRNAVGGVINVITKKPKQTPEMRATAGYGNFNTFEGSFYGTTGLSPVLAADLGLYWHRQYDGWGKFVAAPGQVNPALGKPTFRNHEFAARSKVLITPADTTEVIISADYNKGANALGTTRSLLPGTTVASNVIPNDVGPVGGFWDTRSDYSPQSAFFENWGVNATLNQELGRVNLRSITAYRKVKVDSSGDQDSVEAPVFNAFSPTNLRQFSQEFQLLSSDDSKIKWIAGLYYLDANYKTSNRFIGTLFAPAGTPAANAYNFFSDTRAFPTTTSLAGFGEVTVPVGEQTRVTGGIRYTSDRQTMESYVVTNAGITANSQVEKSKTFRKATWKLSIDHQFTPTVMVYASYNRGFKSGLFSATAPKDPVVNPTVLDAYEIGFKSQLFGNRLRWNASGFYYDIKDIQLTVFNPTGGASLLLLNVPGGKVKGIDVDMEAVPLPNLTIRLGGEYLDTKYTGFVNAPVGTPNPPGAGAGRGGVTIVRQDASGSDFLYSPKWTINASVLYDIATQIGDFNIAVNYYRQTSFLGYFDSFRQSGYDLVNASLGWTSSNERWNAKLWAKNLTNEKYYNHIAIAARRAAGSPGAPRTYGVTVGVNWGG